MIATFPVERLNAAEFNAGFNGKAETPFWAFLFGGLFLYISYYGADQSQVQRELAVGSVTDAKKSLLLNGLARFPLTLLYVLLGIAALSVYQQSPQLASMVPPGNPDYLIPQYIALILPAGLRALLFAALLAAAMSSIDSAINSLSAATVRDFTNKWKQGSENNLYWGKVTTAIWGVLVTGFAFIVENISGTVIEAINKIGSAFYGPILAAFLAGIISKKVRTGGIIRGLIVGVAFNLFLWIVLPAVHWMWWNLLGCIVAFAMAYLFSIIAKQGKAPDDKYMLSLNKIIKREKDWKGIYILLGAYFLLILAVIILLSLL